MVSSMDGSPDKPGTTAKVEATELRGPQERPLDRRRQGFRLARPPLLLWAAKPPAAQTVGSRKIVEDFLHLFPGFSSVPSESSAFSP